MASDNDVFGFDEAGMARVVRATRAFENDGPPQRRPVLTAVARLPTFVGPCAPIGRRVRDTSTLRFLCSLCLRLRRRRLEGDERVRNVALHGILSRAVEGGATNQQCA